MLRKKTVLFIAIILVFLIVLGLFLSYKSSIRGTVVDAETGQPVEGAVVLAEWTKQIGIGDYHTESIRVVEAVTDKRGKFFIFGPFHTFFDDRNVTIYKKGYVAWSNRWIFPDDEKRTDFHWGYNVFNLDRFKKEYSYIKHTSFIHRAINLGLGTNKQLIAAAYYWEELEASKERDIHRK